MFLISQNLPCGHLFVILEMVSKELLHLVTMEDRIGIFVTENFIDIQLIYSVMPISAIQQRDSVIHIHSFLKTFFSIIVHHEILSIVPCATQQEFVVYPSYMESFASANPKLPVVLPTVSFPLGKRKSALYICEYVSDLQRGLFAPYFKFHI